MRYIDTHAHLTKEYFSNEEIEKALIEASENGVFKIIIPATDENDSKEIINLVDGQRTFAAVGLHPSNATTLKSADFLTNFDLTKIVAIGEIGIDLYHTDNPPIAIQEQVFIKQLLIAKSNKLPVIIHMRESEQEIYAILAQSRFRNLPFVMHSFTSNLIWAKRFIDLGGHISFSGIVTFKNAKDLQEVARQLPLDKIMVETDSPYLSPSPRRGQKNLPKNVVHVAKMLADLRPEHEDEVLASLVKNAAKFFCI